MAKKKSTSQEIPKERLVTVERELPNPHDGKRIYCVVAGCQWWRHCEGSNPSSETKI